VARQAPFAKGRHDDQVSHPHVCGVGALSGNPRWGCPPSGLSASAEQPALVVAGLHAWTLNGITDRELEEALYRAVELDPSFGPYYEHALHWASAKGHADRFEELMAGSEQVGHAPERVERMRVRWDLFQGDEAEVASAVSRLAQMTALETNRVDQSAIGLVDAEMERLEPLLMHLDDPSRRLTELYDQQGRLGEMVRVAPPAGAGALTDAVFRVEMWSQEGAVTDHVIGILDEALASADLSDPEMKFARTTLDKSLGRPVDWAALGEELDRGMDEFLPTLPAYTDTAGIRAQNRADGGHAPARAYL